MSDDTNSQHSADRTNTVRRRVVLLTLSIVAIGILYLGLRRSGVFLNQAERSLLGTWTIPLPEPVPPNTVRTLYQFDLAGRFTIQSLLVNPIPGATDQSRAGSWQLQEGVLLMESSAPDPRYFLDRLLRQPGQPSRDYRRMTIVELTENTLRLQESPDSVILNLVRHSE